MTDLKLAAQKALEAARPYVEDASQRGYDGTNGTSIRAEAKRKLALIDVALSALQHQEEREPTYEERVKELAPELGMVRAASRASLPLLQKEEGDV